MISLIKQLRFFRGNIINFKRAYPHLSSGTNPWKYFGQWRASLQPGHSPISDRRPWITFGALQWLDDHVKNGWHVFEYGMGGSTLYWLDKGCNVQSVEHHRHWFEEVIGSVSSNAALKAALHEPKPPRNLLGNNSPYVSEFGKWKGMNFEAYVRAAEKTGDLSLDLALVDGRARRASVMAILPKIKPGGYLVLDNAERLRYAPAIETLLQTGWTVMHFAGPGPYQQGAFWCTSIFEKPGSRISGESP